MTAQPVQFEPFELSTGGYQYRDPTQVGRKSLRPDAPGILKLRILSVERVPKSTGTGTVAKYVFQAIGPRIYDPDAEGVLFSNHPWPESTDQKEHAAQRRWHTDIYMSGLSASGQEQQVLQRNVAGDPRQWVGMELFAVVRMTTYQGNERGEIANYVHRQEYERFPGRMPDVGDTAQVSAVAPGQFGGGAPSGQGFSAPVIGQAPGGWQTPQPNPVGFGNGTGPGVNPVVAGINPALAMTRPR